MNKITPAFFCGKSKKAIKVLSCLGLFMATQMGWAQVTLPHYDGLNYPSGESLVTQTAGGWVLNQTATGDLLITEGSLAYEGLAATTGNKVAFSGGGEDAIKVFTQTTSGKVYYSYLLNVTNESVTGYFAGLLANSVATSTGAPGSGAIAATIWTKPSANAGYFNIGISARANQTTVGTGPTNLQYGTVDYPVNTPVFVVVSYEMVSGSANDICNLWVNPVPGQAEPAYTFTVTPSTDLADISGFYIKQNGNSNTPSVEMDEIRFGLTWEEVTPGAPAALVAPVLTADATDNTVDNDIDITFTDDAAWRAAVTAVKVGGTALTAGADYELTAGNLKLKPSGLNALLTVSGSKSITIEATDYDEDAAIVQEINPGMPIVANSIIVIDGPLAPGMTNTVTLTAVDQFNNLVPGYVFEFDATVVNNISTTNESYTVDGVAYTSSAGNVSLTTTTSALGVATFTITLPAAIDGNDGISIQVQMADGATNIGAAFEFMQLASQTITFGSLAPVTYGSASFNLTATASSGLAVTYTSSNPAVATVTSAGAVTIVGVGTTTITASQSGNSMYNAALNATQQLIVNCAQPTATITGTTTICSGSGANIQVAITALVAQQYTVVYTDGTTNYTVTNYTSGNAIAVMPSANAIYTLVSVTGSNPNICNAANSGSAAVTVNVTPAPTGSTTQSFSTNDPVLLSQLVVEGTSVVWYASLANALAGTGALDPNTQLVSGNTYYAMQTVNGCTSAEPLAVLVSITLGSDDFNLAGLTYYPNPVTDVITISYPQAITKIQVFNNLGQLVYTTQPNVVNPTVNLQQLPAANYFMQVEAGNSRKVLQLQKN